MTDREKVIKGLECCRIQQNEVPPICEACPYADDAWGTCEDMSGLLNDAYVMLKAQEPRVMTLEELSEICVEFKNDLIPMSLTHFDLGKIICCMQDGSCRLWSSKPSVKQREDTPWED